MAKAKKTAGKKGTKKSESKKAEATLSVDAVKQATKRKELTPLERIKALNSFSAIVYLALAVAVVAVMASVSAKIGLSIKAPDMLANSGVDPLVPASETLFDVQLRYFLAAILVVAAVGSALLSTKLRKAYEDGVNKSASAVRWVILGLTAGLTLEFVSLIAGINDVMTLKLVGGLIVITALLGWISDKDNGVKGGKWLAFVCALIAGTLAWLPLLGSLFGTSVYGDARFGWHVYALAGVVFLSSMLIAYTQYKAIRRTATATTYVAREEKYLKIDLVTKIAVVLIVLTALAA
jgi:hypothetical protein